MIMIRALLAAGLLATPFVAAGCVVPTTGSHSLSSGTSSYSYTAATPTSTQAALPTPSQFSLKVIELSRDCFGEAGCNVTYRVVPTYIGAGSAPNSSFRLLYEVDGADDVKTGNIEVHNGKYANEQGFGSVPSGSRRPV